VRNTIYSLQAGRALAALAVVALHSSLAVEGFGQRVPLSPILKNGYLGVDFFFVLSGFIIYHSTAGRGRTPQEYAWARFKRVYLPYLPIGVAMALLYTFIPGVSAGGREWSWLPSVTLLPVTANPALSVAWTLKHEILFYTVFGALYFTRTLVPGLVIWAGLIVVNAFAGMKNVPLALINLEFLMGIIAAILYRTRRAHWLMLVVSAGALWLWWMLGEKHEYSLLIGLAVACAIPVVALWETDGNLTVPPWLIFLGAASYAIYLVHGPIVSVAIRLIRSFPWFVSLPLCFAISAAAGVGYYWFVERRLLGTVRRGSKADATVVTAQ
jgi:peptidoglycan/LPS O-acetylase OafA/YrhL